METKVSLKQFVYRRGIDEMEKDKDKYATYTIIAFWKQRLSARS